MNDQSDVLVVGTGYLGREVADLVRRQAGSNCAVYTTTRRRRRMDELSLAGFSPIQFDWTDHGTFRNLPLGRWSANPAPAMPGGGVSSSEARTSPNSAGLRVLVAVSYDRKSAVSRYDSQVGGLHRLLQVLPPEARICYISTTGVYHQTDGRWVDETSPTHPSREGGRVHLQAEQLLHANRPSCPWIVLRLAGIYGPRRVPRAADVVASRPIASPAEGYLNLIHVHDAARCVLAAWDQMNAEDTVRDNLSQRQRVGMQHRLYVVADNAPVVRREFYREIARQCGADDPVFTAAPDDAPVRMRSDSNKRICNRKMRRELVNDLRYPDYRSGLADVLQTPLK